MTWRNLTILTWTLPALVFISTMLTVTPVEGDDAAYEYLDLNESVPDKPWHTHFVDETAATPKGIPNAGASYMNNFLKACMENRLQNTAAGAPWQEYPKFLGWAVWGYLSPDSAYTGNERLITMSSEWLDRLFSKLRTKPEDPEEAKKWQPDRLGSWSFCDYSLPMLELEARPELAAKVGKDRVATYREILLKNIRDKSKPESWNKLLQRAQPYINIATHQMGIYVHGWLLTGEEKYWRMAASLVAVLARDQLPNGMFPYRYHIYGEDHVEFEGMYYHAMNVRALYMYWWATKSPVAQKVFDQSVPYYPLNMEPPHRFNDGPAIWWKNIWRTFWPQHIAMVAAATGDGENATIALTMARNKVSHDRIDLLLGAHAYQLMAVQDVEPKPVRDRYITRDPDIRGVRLRFSPWSSTFTTGSFTYTRASAIMTNGFNALHMARPYVRVTPLQKKPKYERDYGTLSRHGAAFSAALMKTGGAVATRYQLANTAQTWRKHQSLAPFDMTELWIMTEHGMIGIIRSGAQKAFNAYELNHQFRLIVGRKGAPENKGEQQWTCGSLKFRVWDTDFPHAIEERTRRFAMVANRVDWQLSLADMDRLPEQIAQDGPPPPNAPNPEMTTDAAPADEELVDELTVVEEKPDRLPKKHTFPADYSRFSVVEVSPADAGFSKVTRLKHDTLTALSGQTGRVSWTAVYNPTETEQEWKPDKPAAGAAASWTDELALDGKAPVQVPAKAVLLLKASSD